MERLYYQTLTVPAGTAISAAVSQAWPLEDNQLKSVEVTIPDGHCGLTGFRMLQAQQQIFPWGNSSYIIANDERIPWAFEDEMTSTGIVLQGYNTDIFPHTFYAKAVITNLPAPGSLPEAETATSADTTVPDLTDEDDLTPDALIDTGEIPVVPPEPAPVAGTPLPPPKPAKAKPKPKPKVRTIPTRLGSVPRRR
jgi:hypothetical protein